MARDPASIASRALSGQFLLAKRVQGVSPKTLHWYKESLADFYAFAGHQLGLPPGDVEREHLTKSLILAWIVDMQGGDQGKRWNGASPLKDVSINTRYRAIRAHVRWLMEEELLPEKRNPLRGIKAPHYDEGMPPLFKPEHLARMLEHCPMSTWWGARDRALVLLIVTSGLRREELSNLDVDDIDTDARTIRVRRGKGGRGRIAPLHDVALETLIRYDRHRRPDPPALFQTTQAKRLSGNAIQQVFDKLVKRAGITDTRVSAHTARHTAAVEMLRAGVDLEHVRRVLGHKSVIVTQKYLRAVPEDAALRAYEQAKTFDGWNLGKVKRRKGGDG